jgi:hypothetical protein
MIKPQTYLAALTLALSWIVWTERSTAAALTYTLSPQGPVEALPRSDVFFSLTTDVDLPNLDNLTADIVPRTFAAPGFQPGYSTVLPGSGFQDSFVLNFFGNDLPAGQYNKLFDLLILDTAPVGSSLMLDFKTQATGPNGNDSLPTWFQTWSIEVVPEPGTLILLIYGVMLTIVANATFFRQSTGEMSSRSGE